MAGTVEKKLAELGIVLPEPVAPVAAAPVVRTEDSGPAHTAISMEQQAAARGTEEGAS